MTRSSETWLVIAISMALFAAACGMGADYHTCKGTEVCTTEDGELECRCTVEKELPKPTNVRYDTDY